MDQVTEQVGDVSTGVGQGKVKDPFKLGSECPSAAQPEANPESISTAQASAPQTLLESAGQSLDNPTGIVYFDANCPLCRMLATFMEARIEPELMTFQPSKTPLVQQLKVEVSRNGEQNCLLGEDAWSWILEHHPSLQELNWLAQKLGIGRGAAKTMMTAGGLLRRLCLRCR